MNRSFHATIYVEKARVLRSKLTNVSPVLSVDEIS